jgi:hypothetical protein
LDCAQHDKPHVSDRVAARPFSTWPGYKIAHLKDVQYAHDHDEHQRHQGDDRRFPEISHGKDFIASSSSGKPAASLLPVI